MAFYAGLRDGRIYPPGRSAPGQAGWIADRLLRLRAMLNADLKNRRRPDSLVIGSWNIRHFDGGRPRLAESFHYIAEIIDHFDICAVQEVKGIPELRRLLRLLGPNWDFFVNDSGGAGRGNHERMAFLYNRNRVWFRNLIGELVVPRDALPGGEQIGRTPFFASFQAGWYRFTLCSTHIVFEEKAGRPLREDEIRVIGTELSARAMVTDETHVFLGDFNIVSREDAGMRALKAAGFDAPEIGATSLDGTKHYDQIAFAGPKDVTRMLSSGVIRWQDAVFLDAEAAAYEAVAAANRAPPNRGVAYRDWPAEYLDWRTHEMSDHLPIWIELEIDFSNRYLRRISDGTLGPERPE